MPRPDGAPVVIVGAGPAGLGVAGALAHRGIAAVVLERDDKIGARWRGSYDRLRLHTVRRFSGLPESRIPRRCTRYVATGRTTPTISSTTYDVSASTCVSGSTCGACRRTATGGASRRTTPSYAPPASSSPRAATPGGTRLARATEFAASAAHADFRCGISGEASGIGPGTAAPRSPPSWPSAPPPSTVSVRTPPPIARRQVAGVPLQLLGIALAPLPAGPVDRVGALLRRRVGRRPPCRTASAELPGGRLQRVARP